MLSEIKGRAKKIYNTSNMKPRDLRERITMEFSNTNTPIFSINVMSFGFKNGIPIDADLVFDVRCFPNPFYIDELKSKTGNDKEVQDYVMKTGHFLFTGAVMMNEEAFQALPEDLQQILIEACAEIQQSTSESFVENEEKLLQQCADNGMTIIDEAAGLDLAAFKDSVAKKVDETFGEQYAAIYAEIEELKASVG